jgi:LysM repeat protein
MNERRHKFFSWQAAVLLFVTVLAVPFSLEAQTTTPVPVTISKERIVVEGKVYYMHQVLKGQTLYSIARAYSVSVDLVSRENGITDNSIKDGQVLRIPAAAVAQGQAAMKNGAANSQIQANNQPQSNSQAGQANQPGRSTQNSQAGQGRPAATTAESRNQSVQTPATQDERFIYHRVKKGETLGTIANDYGISVRNLKKANRELLFPHEGDFLLIPRSKVSGTGPARRTEQEQVAEVTLPDSVTADSINLSDESEVFTVPGEKSVIDRLGGRIRVAVLLPFFIRENNTRASGDTTTADASGNFPDREPARAASAIYDGSLPFLEAYEGVLIAADSLRALGLKVELEVYDTGADSAEVKRLIRSGELEDADLIIGPVFSYNLEQIAGWAAERDIPVVSPVALRDSHIHENKPALYRVFPSQAAIQEVIAAEVGAHPGSRVIFLHSDSAMYDPATVRLWQMVKGAAGETSDTGGGRVVPYYFTGVTEKRNVYSNVASFESLLDQSTENIIVLATTSTPVVSSAFSALHSLIKRYNIMVVGYPEIRGFETIDLKYFYDLELFIPSESYIDFESPAAMAFSSVFMKKFRTEPMAESFAWRGFDIGWYFMGGIATGGKQFLKDPGTFNPALLSLEPDFRRDSRQNGYENHGIFMLHYRKDMSIEIRRPTHQ